jgi:uridine phosphorylase
MRNIIAESELILNKDGSVYHLNLLPEEISDTIITVGDPDRVSEVSKHFDNIEVKKAHREFVTHTGSLNGKRITVISTGIGTDNIDIVMNELDALVNIDLKTRTIKDTLSSLNIIRVGTCGGLQKYLGVDSYVVSEGALGMDSLLHQYELPEDYIDENGEIVMDSWNYSFEISNAFDEHINSLVTQSYYAEGTAEIVNQFAELPNFHKGLTVTCSGFYGPQGRVLRLKPAISDFIPKLISFRHNNKRVLNFEMETSGIYALGRLMNHRCCSLSVVVANRAEQKFSANAAASVNNLIATVLETLSK